MGLFLDRVKQTTNTTGIGDLTLLPPSATYQSFAAFGDGQQAAYVIAHPTLNQWEVGIGTVHTAGPTLTRTTVLAGSNGTIKVNFSEGTKVVGNPLPASFANQVSKIANGAGVPDNALGNNGDYYFRTTTNDLYYKSGGTYSIISRLGGTITLTGDATATGTGSIAVTLATVNSNVGTFSKVTVNAKGLVTAATNIASGDVTTALGFTPANAATLGTAGGIATLDGAGHLLTSQLPPGLVSGLTPVGTWNANTNTPTLTSSSGNEGDLFIVSVAGTTTLDGISVWNVGDSAFFAGGFYHRVSGGSGSVYSISVVTANGISGSVANATTAPAITLTLGAITPTSIVCSGSISGSNLSGTNTGDQNITLTGDVTGAGTGTFAATLATVNSDIGEFNKLTVNAKGLVTAAENMTDADIIATLGYTPADEAMIDQPDGIAPLDSDGLVPTWNLPPFGTVTTVSVVSAHGISGTVATDTTTPAITLTLGAITPSSIVCSGSVSGTNLSGTNTGDQTIALTGDVTGTGTGTFAATLATVNSNVGTFSKLTVNGKGLVTAATNIGSTDVTTALGFMPIDVATKGVAGGVASLDGSGKVPSSQLPSGGGGGSGTVTSVSVVTANGVSGTVATSTTTPAITLTLGAITPTTIVASSTIAGSNLSGTNTGDQTITLTGDVTGSGTGSFAATLATVNSNVGTFSKLTVNGKGLVTAATNLTATDISLGSVTNDAQTKAAIVPNTAPSSGQVLIGNSGGTAYAKQTISGNGATITLSDAGVITISAIANASLTNSSVTIAGTSTSLGGSISQDTITGLSSTGLVKRTGANTLAIATAGTDYAAANASVTISGHSLSLGGSLSLVAGDVSLGNVTNDAQTKAAIVPNTAPSSGQVLIGNSGGTAYAKQTISGSGATITLSDAGVITISAIANASLTNSAITIAGTSTSLGGSITQDTITGLSSTGLIKRTGANTLAVAAAGTDYAAANASITIAGTSTSLGGSISQDTITGLSSTGLIKRTGANTLAVAAAGTDYAAATSGTSILYGNGSGGFLNVTVGATLSFSAGTLGIDLTNANTWTGVQTFAKNNIGVTSTTVRVNSNSQSATNILDQWSPREEWVSQYYSGGTKSSSWGFENRAGVLTWTHNDNGAGFGSPIMALAQPGTLSVPNVNCSNGTTTGILNVSSLATFSGNGAASTPGLLITGTPYTGGSATTNFPQLYINNGASGPTTFSTSGTEFGINAPSAFAGNMIVCHVNGAASVFSVTAGGALTCSGLISTSSSVQISSSGSLTFSARGSLTSPASGQVQIGTVDSTTAQAQTLRVQSIAGASNVSGADWTLLQSCPSGTGTAGNLVHSGSFSGLSGTLALTSISNASPAVFTVSGGHGCVPGQTFRLTTTGTLPTGLALLTTYYVIATGLTPTTFQASATPGGSALNTSSAGSGTHTLNWQSSTQNPGTATETLGPSGLTGSQATSVVAIQQWWNTTGTPTLIKATAHDVASNAASLLFDLQREASGTTTDVYTIDKNGNTYIAGTVSGYLAKINAQTGTTYTLLSTDSGSVIECNNASAITVTLPNNLPVGWNCRVVQTGAGQVTFSPASGASLVNRSSYTKTAGQQGEVDLYVTTNSGGASAVYRLGGDGA